MSENLKNRTTTVDVDDAVGVQSANENRHWFIAVVNRNSEKLIRERLLQKGYESYVASQQEEHRWANGRKKKVERVVITARIFIHLTETERREVVHLPYINYFMTDKAMTANTFGNHPLAVVPDREMQMLRFMLCNAEAPVDFVTSRFRAGDKIRIVRGPLKGFEGEVARFSDDTFAFVRLSLLGVALTRVIPQDIEII